jgi:ATP-dependent exoDNAse (exonuclease V) beta subunit
MLGCGYNIEDDETSEDADRDRSQALGLLAHRIMEAVGSGCGLDHLCSENFRLHQDLMGIDEAEAQEVLSRLCLLKDHPLVKEMEAAQECRNEFQIIRPFGRYFLSGRPDKVIKTPDGWKILDFKFSGSERHSEDYEFQMKFYLYIAREIFLPLLGAELFYFKDGVSVKVQLNEEEVRDFENDLFERIEGYQAGIIRRFQMSEASL